MTLSQIRSQVKALCRKYATELALYRARPVASDFCDEMASAVTGDRSGPKLTLFEWTQILHNRLWELGLRLNSSLHVEYYFVECLERRVLPQVNDLLRTMFPRADERGLIPRSPDPVPFQSSLD